MIAQIPRAPYYAVIFGSVRTAVEDKQCAEMAEKMEALAKQQDGFPGMESARNQLGVSISYWRDLDSIRNWKNHAGHIFAQQIGQKQWYRSYKTRTAVVERDCSFEK